MRGALRKSIVVLESRALQLALALGMCLCARAVHADGTWVMAPPNAAAGGQAFGLWMMTDGTILSHGSALNHWVILTPDRKGDYSKGTWKDVASNPHARGGAQQHILKDGRFFQAGGEYVDGPACTPQLCIGVEIFDPVKNVWTVAANGIYEIADTGSASLPDGRVISSSRSSNKIQIYDPDTDKWTPGGTLALTNGDENSWATLQNGGILAVGYKSDGAAIYNPETAKWIKTGPVPSGFNTGDTGGISMMFDGRVLVYGMAGALYIYTPGPTANDPGSWKLGPKAVMGGMAEDEFTTTTPWGKVWGALVKMTYGPGVVLQEFDPDTDTVKSVPPPPDKGNPYPIGYINLPDGQVMVTAERNDWIYTSDQQPKDEWRPVVTSVKHDGNGIYTLTGTQITGLINGSDEGDDMTNAANYPIVWLKNKAGDVYFCRSFNFSQLTPSKGDKPETCQFTTPADLPGDTTYDLYVSAVGVRSKDPVPFTPLHDSMPTGKPMTAGTGGSGGAPPVGTGDVTEAGSGGTTGGTGAALAAGSGGPSSAGSLAPGSSGKAGNAAPGTGVLNGANAGSKALGGAAAGRGASDEGAPDLDKKKSGCGCYVAGSSTTLPVGWSAGLVLAAWLRVRRRRPRSA